MQFRHREKLAVGATVAAVALLAGDVAVQAFRSDSQRPNWLTEKQSQEIHDFVLERANAAGDPEPTSIAVVKTTRDKYLELSHYWRKSHDKTPIIVVETIGDFKDPLIPVPDGFKPPPIKQLTWVFDTKLGLMESSGGENIYDLTKLGEPWSMPVDG